jgi:hypothetical protein
LSKIATGGARSGATAVSGWSKFVSEFELMKGIIYESDKSLFGCQCDLAAGLHQDPAPQSD